MMDDSNIFDFGNDSVAKAYDSILVPVLFEPWAKSLIAENEPWLGKTVLELACGTGVVTKELALNVLPEGRILALDINAEMINLAKVKCNEWANQIEFIEGSAESLSISDNSIDKVICQQGFQFFPNKKVAANEIYKVLKPNGTAVLSTWCHVSECEIFNAICESLEELGLTDISQSMRIPFDLLTEQGLLDSFNGIGFSSVKISKQVKKINLNGDLNRAIKFVYSTPIGPKLNSLSSLTQQEFKKIFADKINQLKDRHGNFGQMASNILTVQK